MMKTLRMFSTGAHMHRAGKSVGEVLGKVDALKENKKFVVLNEVPQLNTSRITLTYPVLKNAKEVLVLMKGEQKEQIMNQMYSEENISYPMYKVIQEQNNLSWIISK